MNGTKFITSANTLWMTRLVGKALNNHIIATSGSVVGWKTTLSIDPSVQEKRSKARTNTGKTDKGKEKERKIQIPRTADEMNMTHDEQGILWDVLALCSAGKEDD